MAEKERGYRPLKKENERGAAMVIVLCVLAVFLALSASVLINASVAMNTARNNVILEQCKIQAVTLSDLFVKELEKGSSGPTVDKPSQWHLGEYIQRQITGDAWPAYDKDNKNTVKRFTMDVPGSGESAVTYQMQVEMYWTSDGDQKPGEGTEIADGKISFDAHDLHLHVAVISTSNNGNFRVDNEFKLSILESSKASEENKKNPLYANWMWEAIGRK